MKKDLLLRLADLLEENAANEKGMKFDLGGWGANYKGQVDVSCNTTGCAMGLAVVSGKFKEEGLYNYSISGCGIVPAVKCHTGFSAATVLFDIDYDTARELFSEENYRTAQRRGAEGERAVAKRIRHLVEHGETGWLESTR